jgi:hypothetical protein
MKSQSRGARATRSSPKSPARRSKNAAMLDAGLAVFFVIAKDCGFSAAEQAGMLRCSSRELREWKRGGRPRATPARLVRVRQLLLIYRCLVQFAGTEPNAQLMLSQPCGDIEPRRRSWRLRRLLAHASQKTLADMYSRIDSMIGAW